MLVERAIKFTERLVIANKHSLSDREKNILRGSWENLTYEAIKEHYETSFSHCKVSFIKKILGYELWKKVTNAFVAGNIISPDSKVHKLNFRKIIDRYEQQHELNLGSSSKNGIIGDRYRILSSINQTEYIKTTYLAQHLNYFDRECIIEQFKITPHSNLELLTRRANILRDLGEKTVSTAKLFGWFEREGYWHLVYESVRGTSLSEEFKASSDRYTESQAKALLKEILEILYCLHQCNIVHRQISPDNLIRHDRDYRLVLFNFEIAKYINSENSFFLPPYYQLNLCYSAPEFFNNPTFATDIYSVGKIIIQALTKLTPNKYRHNTLDWHNYANICLDFQDILDKMVRENYRNRYQSAREILIILEN